MVELVGKKCLTRKVKCESNFGGSITGEALPNKPLVLPDLIF